MGKRVTRLKIEWSGTAFHDFISILNYIKSESPTNAKRVKTRIINIIISVSLTPKMFREDELKDNNDGSYRVFNKDNIRVSYKIETKKIFITRVTHSSKEPKSF